MQRELQFASYDLPRFILGSVRQGSPVAFAGHEQALDHAADRLFVLSEGIADQRVRAQPPARVRIPAVGAVPVDVRPATGRVFGVAGDAVLEAVGGVAWKASAMQALGVVLVEAVHQRVELRQAQVEQVCQVRVAQVRPRERQHRDLDLPRAAGREFRLVGHDRLGQSVAFGQLRERALGHVGHDLVRALAHEVVAVA